MRNKMLCGVLAMFVVACLTGLVVAQDHHAPKEKMPPAANPNAGFLGAKFSPINDEIMEELKLDSPDGVFVVELVEGAPAEKYGLMQNDIIHKIDGKEISGVEDFVQVMSQSKPGQEMKFSVQRGKEVQELTITLGKRPPMREVPKEAPEKKETPATKPD